MSLPAEEGSEAGERQRRNFEQRRNFQARTRSQREFRVVNSWILKAVSSGPERARAKVGEVRMARQETGVGEEARSQRALKAQQWTVTLSWRQLKF